MTLRKVNNNVNDLPVHWICLLKKGNVTPMFKTTLLTGLISVSAVLGLTESAKAVVINFDSLAGNTVITNQFPEATFTSNSGFEIRTLTGSFGASAPNVILATNTTGTPNTNQDIFVNFAQAVNNLSFRIVGDNSTSPGLVNIFTSGVLAGQVNMVADGNGSTSDLVNLASFTNITSISMTSITDPGGIGYDDFTFDVAPAQSVPEPTTMLGLLTSGGFLVTSRRKFKQQLKATVKA
ncbi:PEP-CTERM sorting domain-containing protein [Cylindrospermum sp. FACHB-282]|uniref:PEP-CTERM sorting domain-containing protein n=1 Tax=Cylindrospermum sp. FACHB-282 TaxID=2692794 RepID=UPI001687D94B|nr:PEP-CTERM sorting domain-containing protein [Cylindrospermum sp. FACHB-282]MBD2384432.1 PEP-CTERM sorting domain-containing protein [Cylindrospermum sp. FACHB-282]